MSKIQRYVSTMIGIEENLGFNQAIDYLFKSLNENAIGKRDADKVLKEFMGVSHE